MKGKFQRRLFSREKFFWGTRTLEWGLAIIFFADAQRVRRNVRARQLAQDEADPCQAESSVV